MLVGFTIGAGVLGLIIGWLLGIVQNKTTSGTSDLNKELDAARLSLREYQQQVTDHVSKTNDLIENIHAQTSQLQEHIQAGTMTLNRDTSRQSLLQPSGSAHGLSQGNIALEKPNQENEQPKDYAAS
jgi:uncharacterized membrane-anchored protein YhcB (DUF1043 family)